MPRPPDLPHVPFIPRLLFMSRWLQLPLYVGLILALGVYVFHFWVELTDLVGAAFGNLVTKFTESFINPLIRLATGGVEFGGKIVLVASPDKSSEIAINYGNFITALVTFLITAAVVYYAVVLPLGRLNERLGLAPKAAGPTTQEQLLAEIRDLLKKQ